MHKVAATIWADTLQLIVCASGAIGAFIGAYPRLIGLWWQIAVANFTIGSKLQHGASLQKKRAGRKDRPNISN